MRLKDKVAIVTGGGRGIGKAISLAFASEGAAVVLTARTPSYLEEAAEEIRSRHGTVMVIQADVAHEEQVRQMVSKTMGHFGHVDILVNNGGVIGPIASVAEMDLKAWNETLSVNLTGAMLCSREVLRHMIPQKTGTIINIVSEAGRGGDGRTGRPLRSAYGCSKMGLIGLTEAIAVEAGEYGIRANAISPGSVNGERAEFHLRRSAQAMGISPEEFRAQMVTNYSLGRIADESEVASVAVFLASNEASALTGQVIAVNCGHHIIF